jgi:hypothetical protein
MTLDHFEQSLLTDLRAHVAERGASTARTPRRSRRWPWVAVPAGAAAAVAGAVVFVLAPTAAYAVSESGGEVVVTITRLDDAAGLERALAQHGITAEVDYSATVPDLPPNAPGPVETGSATGPGQAGPSLHTSGTPPEDAPGRPDITSSIDGDEFTLRIVKDSLPPHDVLHITTSGSAASGATGLQVMFTRDR